MNAPSKETGQQSIIYGVMVAFATELRVAEDLTKFGILVAGLCVLILARIQMERDKNGQSQKVD